MSRNCTSGGAWAPVNIHACPLMILIQISQEVMTLTNSNVMFIFFKVSKIQSGNTNLTSQEENELINAVTKVVINATQQSNESLLTSDVVNINTILDSSINILTGNIQDTNISNPFLETVSYDDRVCMYSYHALLH